MFYDENVRYEDHNVYIIDQSILCTYLIFF